MDCPHNSLTRQEDNDLYVCQSCGEMFTTTVYEIKIQRGTPEDGS